MPESKKGSRKSWWEHDSAKGREPWPKLSEEITEKLKPVSPNQSHMQPGKGTPCTLHPLWVAGKSKYQVYTQLPT